MNDRKLFAVVGRPVLHSLSPVLFRSAYREKASTAVYTRVSACSAAEALRFGGEVGLAGMNVTAPLKEGIFSLLDSVDDAAAAVGAVNTLVRQGESYRGFNTDPAGVAGAFERAGIDVRGKRCLVLGAGGAGRAAVFALQSRGAEVVLCNRTDGKALTAARKLGAAFEKWDRRSSALAASDVLVSGLPPDTAAVPAEWLRPGLVVLEAAYPEPPLTCAARKKGCLVIPGEDWLYRQAVPAFRLFAGSDPDETAMATALKSARKRISRAGLNVALVGFMGSGKTTAGRLLAGELGLDFADSDEWIEQRTGRSVPDIFRRDGESFFRELETLVLSDILAGRGGVVCACGGGSMESGANRALAAANAVVVWLHAAPAVCRARIDAAPRPLIDGRPGSGMAFEELFRRRISCYAEAADIAVGSEAPADRTVRTIHEEIRRAVED
jgi:shikimate dehydrogenase